MIMLICSEYDREMKNTQHTKIMTNSLYLIKSYDQKHYVGNCHFPAMFFAILKKRSTLSLFTILACKIVGI